MYNDVTQSILDIYRKYFGLLALRKRVRGRKDAFYEFHATDEKDSDIEIIRRLSKYL